MLDDVPHDLDIETTVMQAGGCVVRDAQGSHALPDGGRLAALQRVQFPERQCGGACPHSFHFTTPTLTRSLR